MNQVIQGTVRELDPRYKHLSDMDIINDIRMGRCAGEALFYLLFGRYAEMLHIIHAQNASDKVEFDDFMLELDIKLFARQCTAIINFDPNRASFKTFLSKVAHNLLYDLNAKELPMLDIGIVDDDMYDDSSFEMFAMMDAINNYPNFDSRYVLLKTIEGYKSKEIATMLSNRKHEDGSLDLETMLKPSYIDTLRSRALKAIREQLFLSKKGHICTQPSLSQSSALSDSSIDMECPMFDEAYNISPIQLFNISPIQESNPYSQRPNLFTLNFYQLYNQMLNSWPSPFPQNQELKPKTKN